MGEVLIKLDRDELVVTDSRYPQGESGPGPHVHREHTDSFWVVEGQLVFEVGGERVEVGEGGFVAVPPNVVHTFRNEGPGEARFLNLHSPGCGFADHLRAMAAGADGSDDFDTFDPPPDGGRPAAEAIIHASDEGERV